MTDNSRNGDRTWTFCDPSLFWSGQNYDHGTPEFRLWTRLNAYKWMYVTCEKCLSMRRRDRRK
jgi:hypothetical protein